MNYWKGNALHHIYTGVEIHVVAVRVSNCLGVSACQL